MLLQSTRTAILLSIFLVAQIAWGQGAPEETEGQPKYMQFGSGHLRYRTYTHMQYVNVGDPHVMFLPGEGLDAAIYISRLDGEAGWFDLFNGYGWNCFSMDFVGCGSAAPPPSDDLVYLTGQSVYGTYQIGMATKATLWVAHGLSAAFVMRTRSTNPELIPYTVMFDPIGPGGAQDRVQWTIEEAREYAQDTDRLWQQWGIGPRPGRAYPNSDIGNQAFERVLTDMHRTDIPAYWAAALTGLDTDLRVSPDTDFDGWPVLILRSPNRTRPQIAREEQIADWLRQKGAHVEQQDLADLDLPGLSALPMLGRHAPRIAQVIQEWYEQRSSAQLNTQRSPAP